MEQENDQTENAQCTRDKQSTLYTEYNCKVPKSTNLTMTISHQMSALTVGLDVSSSTSIAIHLNVPLADLIEDPEEVD